MAPVHSTPGSSVIVEVDWTAAEKSSGNSSVPYSAYASAVPARKATSPARRSAKVRKALSSVAAYTLGSKILTWAALPLLAAFPLAGIPAVVALNSALNATSGVCN